MSRLLTSSLLALCVLTAAALPLALSSCTATPAPAGAATAPASGPAVAAAPRKGSAQLWAETCSRCHNLRSPSAYSADQWQVIVHDMRIRAQLTGQDQRQILEFLKSAQ